MKKQIEVLMILLLLFSVVPDAPGQRGIYNTVADYNNEKLSYACAGEQKGNTHIRLNDLFGYAPYITVKEAGANHKISKDSLYGFRTGSGVTYRFFNNREYRIAEAGDIFIYTALQNVVQGKCFKPVTAYFFSTSPSGSIFPLTLNYLEAAYQGNNQFIGLLEQYTMTNDVAAYDELHHTFMVNYLFRKSKRQ